MQTPVCWYSSRHAQKPDPNNPSSGEVAFLNVESFPAPFIAQHNTDAHFWPYAGYLRGQLSEVQFSLPTKGKKPQGLDSDESVMMHYLVMEWDTPNHGEMSMDQRGDFLEKLSQIPEDHVLLKLACLYPTRGGFRFVYRLDTPLLWELYQAKVRGLMAELALHTGLECDVTSDQWWRAFRLPQVIRGDGKDEGPSWTRPWFEPYFLIDEEALVDPFTEVPNRQERLPWDTTKGADLSYSTAELPDRDFAIRLCTKDFVREAKKHLKNSRCAPHIFDDLPVSEGNRNNSLLAFPGEVVARLYGRIQYVTPEHCYGLLLPVAESMERSDSVSWEEQLWRLVQHAWNSHIEKEATRLEDLEENTQTFRGFLEQLSHNFPNLPEGDEERRNYLMRHILLGYGRNYYIAESDGKYAPRMFSRDYIPAVLRDRQYSKVMRLYQESGEMRSGQSMFNDYGTPLADLLYEARTDHGAMVEEQGEAAILRISPFRINPVVWEARAFDREIDSWLRHAFADDHERINHWIAAAVGLQKGNVPALSLRGPKGTGKSLLALALAEVFGGQPVPGIEAFDEFNYGLVSRSPVVLVDEGLPSDSKMSVPDLFRTVTVGSPYSVCRKFHDPATSTIPLRIVITSNNSSTLRSLAGGRVLSQSDVEALTERILHIDVSPSAANYLGEHGHMAFTRYDKKGPWVGPGDGCVGFRAARHFAALYEAVFETNEADMIDGRMLVKGSFDANLAAALESGGATAEVATIINEWSRKLIEGSGVSNTLTEALVFRENALWFRRGPLKALILQTLRERSMSFKVSPNEVGDVLTRWSTGVVVDKDWESTKRSRWNQLRVSDFKRLAEFEGEDTEHLRSVSRI